MLTKESILKVEQFLRRELTKELIAQGHKLSGNLIQSIRFISAFGANGFEFAEYHLLYGNILNNSIHKSRIPYSGNGGGGTSKYIQALMEFVRQRAIATGDREIKNIAFAIANKQKQEGMPTNASIRFSKTGKRVGWITDTLEKNRNNLRNLLQGLYGNDIQFSIDIFVRNWNKSIP